LRNTKRLVNEISFPFIPIRGSFLTMSGTIFFSGPFNLLNHVYEILFSLCSHNKWQNPFRVLHHSNEVKSKNQQHFSVISEQRAPEDMTTFELIN